MHLTLIFYAILFLRISKSEPQFSPLLEIEQGILRGVLKKDIKGGEFYSFLSVPFARKPIGKLRFMVPVIGDKWDGILNATEDMPPCAQLDWVGNIVGQEDCLYLNIYTPDTKFQKTIKELKPVMVYIHGGSFLGGDGRYELHGPEFLMPQNVILVTLNYRLGLFGFLNFENTKLGALGNMGLKDQNMALQWVQRNIKKFGGDPNCVTIFGDSAGGASVHLHMLSPMSQGLFHRVIAQSGTALNTWATNGGKNTGVHAAKFLGYKGIQESQMLTFLQEVSVLDILKVQENASIVIPLHEPSLVGPRVEDAEVIMPFLHDNPTTLISSKKFKSVPFMLGFTSDEGIIWDLISLIQKQELQDVSPEETIFYSFHITNEDVKREIAKQIKQFYYKDKYSSADRLARIKHAGDVWVNWELLKSVKTHAKLEDHDLYLYMLSADTKLNYFKSLHPTTAKLEGTCHGDDLGYIFKTKYTPDIKPGSPEWNAMETVVKLWTNFAKYGNPTPKFGDFHPTWEPIKEHTLNYMDIGTNRLSIRTNPFHKRMIFWDKLEEEYVKGRGTVKHIHSEM